MTTPVSTSVSANRTSGDRDVDQPPETTHQEIAPNATTAEKRGEAAQLDPEIGGKLKRTADGLVCVVAQERGTGDVLMVAWMDDEALHRTLTTRKATYYSRSRQEYWVKGETSGHTQYVHEVRLDCDGDTVLLVVDQVGAACHTGTHTCFDSTVLLSEAE